jgi:hypothetical protein
MADSFKIEYLFEFSPDLKKSFTLILDRSNLQIPPADVASPPEWTALDFNRCPICKLDSQSHPECPVALNLVALVETFKDFVSYDEVTVTVTTEERSFSKKCDLQTGLSPMLGIIMVASGCPTMDLLKPNVRFHLPFTSLEEMAYRSFTMYLLGQYYRQRQGKGVDWSFDGFRDIFDQVTTLNSAFSERLLAAAKKDASINALVSLCCMGQMTPGVIPDILNEMEQYFSAYK